jgi:GrpB-like predicted nucleotidyltransferase (UPF0157 family)
LLSASEPLLVLQTERVHVVRFDPDIAKRRSAERGISMMGELVGSAVLSELSVLYLDTDSRFNSEGAEARQLLAVLSGSCTLDAEGFEDFVLFTGRAVVAEQRERWSIRATEPVTALWAEGSFDVRGVVVTKDIEVVDYDDAWITHFEQIRDSLWPRVGDIALRLDHVGSTGVPGLAAKPIIDVDIVASTQGDVALLIDLLAEAGYRWRGDLGVTGREAFERTSPADLPEHHLYVVVDANRAHVDHLLLRDLLREDDSAREAYAQLKRTNEVLANGNMDVYTAAKAEFVAQLLTRARVERNLAPVEYWTP